MNIYESITAAMKDIGAIGKNSRNQQQGFMFRGIDAVMNGIHPALEKNNIFIVPEILEQTREERTTSKGGTLIYSICKIKYTFYAEDGTNVTAVVIGEGMDSGDKATNKAMSIAYKYACFQVFCIPTEDMEDPDSTTPDASTKGNGKKQNKQQGNAVAKQPERQAQQPPEEHKSEIPAAQPNDIIDAKSVELLRGMFLQKDIDEQFVCNLYKMQAIESTTQSKYTNIIQHLDDIKAKQEAKK